MLQAGMLAIVCKLATIKFCLATHCLIYGIVKALQTKSPSCIEYIASVEDSYLHNSAVHNMCCIESDIYCVSTSAMMITIRTNYSCYKQILQYLIIHHSFNILHVRPYNTVYTGPLAS